MAFLYFLLFIFVFHPAEAEIPGQQVNKKTEEIAPLDPPDPARLRPTWWSYFETDPEKLEERIQKASSFLESLPLTLPEKQREQAIPLIQEIIINLKSYAELRKQKAKAAPQDEAAFKKTYSLEEFIQLGKLLNENNHRLTSKNLKARLEKSNIRSDQSRLDTQMALYLSQPKSDPQRVIKGLSIMAKKISIANEEKQMQELNAEIEADKLQIKLIENEIAYARNHIDASKIKLGELEQNVKRAQDTLSREREALLSSQAKLAVNHTLLADEQFLFHTLKHALAELNLIDAKLELALGTILIHPEKKDIQTYYRELAELEEKQNQIALELEDWKKVANHNLEKGLGDSQSEVIAIAYNILSFFQKIDSQLSLNDFLFVQNTYLLQTHYISFKDQIIKFWNNFTATFKRYGKWIHISLFKIGQTPITLYVLFRILLTIFIAYFLAKLCRFWIMRIGKKHRRIKQANVYTLGRLAYYIILILGIIVAVTTVGFDFTAFAVVIGALSVGIGFGLQSIVNNFISGIILLLEQNLRVGDFIELGQGAMGSVVEINVRTTLIKTFDNLEILIPNSDLVSKQFTNWTLSERIRRVRIPFSAAFGTDKDFVRKVICEAAKTGPMTLKDREPQVWLVAIGESSLDFELVVWVNESLEGLPPVATKAWYMWAIETALRENDITIPFPVRDVHLHHTENAPL